MANIPGVKVISCIDPADAKGLLKSAIRDDDPVCMMESEIMYGLKGEVPEGEYLVPIGKAAVRKEGSDVTIVSYNKMMEVVKAADFRAGLKDGYRIDWVGEERAKVIADRRFLMFRSLVVRTLGVVREGSSWKIVW